MEILYLSPNNMSKQTDTRWWHGHGGGFSLPVIGFCCVIHSISFPQLPLLDLQLHSPTPVTHLINGLWYWPGLDWSLVQKKLGATGLLDTWLRFEDFWLCVQKPFSVGPDCWVQVWIAALFDHKELLWRRHHSHWTTPGSGLPVGPETWMTCFCLWSFVHRGLWPCSVCGRCRTPASLVSGTSCHVTSTLSSSCRSCRDTAPSSGATTRTAGEFRLNSWICSWGDRLEMTQQSACVCVCVWKGTTVWSTSRRLRWRWRGCPVQEDGSAVRWRPPPLSGSPLRYCTVHGGLCPCMWAVVQELDWMLVLVGFGSFYGFISSEKTLQISS